MKLVGLKTDLKILKTGMQIPVSLLALTCPERVGALTAAQSALQSIDSYSISQAAKSERDFEADSTFVTNQMSRLPNAVSAD